MGADFLRRVRRPASASGCLVEGAGLSSSAAPDSCYSGSDGEALRSARRDRSASSCRMPAAAIIAALSVDRSRLGMNTGISRAAPRALRPRAAAAHSPTRRRRCRSARAVPARRGERALDQRVDHVALEAGGDVADLGVGRRSTPSAACRCRTCRSTAVLRPLKLKSKRPSRSGALRSGCVRRVAGSGSRERRPAPPADR